MRGNTGQNNSRRIQSGERKYTLQFAMEYCMCKKNIIYLWDCGVFLFTRSLFFNGTLNKIITFGPMMEIF